MMVVPEAAREFLLAPASVGAAAALASLEEATLADVVTVLVEQQALAHLAAVADAASLPKAIRKAARFALYQLRSKGVSAPVEARVVTLAPASTVDLSQVAIALFPGLYGRFWLFLGALPGVSAIEVEGEAHGTLKRIEAISGVAPSRLEKLLAKVGAALSRHGGTAEPRIIGADLALRLLDHLTALLRLPGHTDAGGLPDSWVNVLLWREAAMNLGADASRASARAALGAIDPGLVEQSESLLTFGLSGSHAPPPWIAEAILSDVIERAEGAFEGMQRGDEIDEARKALVDEIALAHCDAFLAREPHASRTAIFLEASADGLHALGHDEHARICLALADSMGRVPPRSVPLFAAAFLQMVDPDLIAKARSAL